MPTTLLMVPFSVLFYVPSPPSPPPPSEAPRSKVLPLSRSNCTFIPCPSIVSIWSLFYEQADINLLPRQQSSRKGVALALLSSPSDPRPRMLATDSDTHTRTQVSTNHQNGIRYLHEHSCSTASSRHLPLSLSTIIFSVRLKCTCH
jgi:hypothetical protein